MSYNWTSQKLQCPLLIYYKIVGVVISCGLPSTTLSGQQPSHPEHNKLIQLTARLFVCNNCWKLWVKADKTWSAWWKIKCVSLGKDILHEKIKGKRAEQPYNKNAFFLPWKVRWICLKQGYSELTKYFPMYVGGSKKIVNVEKRLRFAISKNLDFYDRNSRKYFGLL